MSAFESKHLYLDVQGDTSWTLPPHVLWSMTNKGIGWCVTWYPRKGGQWKRDQPTAGGSFIRFFKFDVKRQIERERERERLDYYRAISFLSSHPPFFLILPSFSSSLLSHPPFFPVLSPSLSDLILKYYIEWTSVHTTAYSIDSCTASVIECWRKVSVHTLKNHSSPKIQAIKLSIMLYSQTAQWRDWRQGK